MAKKLYVGSLPFDVKEDQLHEMFTPFGQVTSAKLITDKYSGQSKGFGFVEMASDEQAQAAMQALNGTTVGSRQIVVNEARPMAARGGQGSGGQKGYGRGHGGGNRW